MSGLIVILKEFLKKVVFVKKSTDDKKSMHNYLSMQRDSHITLILLLEYSPSNGPLFFGNNIKSKM